MSKNTLLCKWAIAYYANLGLEYLWHLLLNVSKNQSKQQKHIWKLWSFNFPLGLLLHCEDGCDLFHEGNLSKTKQTNNANPDFKYV